MLVHVTVVRFAFFCSDIKCGHKRWTRCDTSSYGCELKRKILSVKNWVLRRQARFSVLGKMWNGFCAIVGIWKCLQW